MDMPEILRCFGMFPPRYGSFLIAVYGLAYSGLCLAGIILYGLFDESYIGDALSGQHLTIKKAVLLTIGVSSIMIAVACACLLAGTFTSSPKMVAVFVYVILTMCILIILANISVPLSCFKIPEGCILKVVSFTHMVLSCLVFLGFIELWLYFMVVGDTFRKLLGGD